MPKSLRDRIEEDGIRATVTYMDFVRGEWDHNVWSVTFRWTNLMRKRRRMTVPFMTGVGLSQDDVTAESVLSSLISDTVGYDNAGGFPDWCSEYGYDSDSIKARETYDQVARQAGKLYQFLGRRTGVYLDSDQTDWQI